MPGHEGQIDRNEGHDSLAGVRPPVAAPRVEHPASVALLLRRRRSSEQCRHQFVHIAAELSPRRLAEQMAADVGRRREQRQQRSPKRLRRRRAGRARVRRREHCENADDDIVARRRGPWSRDRRTPARISESRCASCIAATRRLRWPATRATIDHERRRRRSAKQFSNPRATNIPETGIHRKQRPGNRRRARTSNSRTPPGPGSRRRALRGRRSRPGDAECRAAGRPCLPPATSTGRRQSSG